MNDNIRAFPQWKKNATAEERLHELLIEARQHPERFARMVVIFEEDYPPTDDEKYGRTATRYVTTGGCSRDILGLIECGKEKLLRWMYDGDD